MTVVSKAVVSTTARELMERAAPLIGEVPQRSGGRRIVVVDGGDGSNAAEVIDALAVIDSLTGVDATLDVGGLPDVADLSEVGAAVVVVDAGGVNTVAVAALVDRWLAACGRVGLVCNRIDVFWQWPQVFASVREQVDPLRLCALFAVVTGADDGAESGMGALARWLQEEPDGRADLAVAAARLKCSELDAGHRQRLKERRAVYLAERDRGRTDRVTALRAEVSRCRAVMAARIHSELRRESALATAAADRVTSRTAASKLADELLMSLDRQTRALVVDLEDRIDRLRAVSLVGLVSSVPSTGGADVAMPRRRLPLPRRTADDALVMMFGASSGFGIGRVVASQLAGADLAWASTPVSVILGISVALWVVRTRRQSALRAVLRSWIVESCSDARAHCEQFMSIRLSAVEPAIVSMIARHYERDGRRISDSIVAIDAQLKGTGATPLARALAREFNSMEPSAVPLRPTKCDG